jgi:hypothetical protein
MEPGELLNSAIFVRSSSAVGACCGRLFTIFASVVRKRRHATSSERAKAYWLKLGLWAHTLEPLRLVGSTEKVGDFHVQRAGNPE